MKVSGRLIAKTLEFVKTAWPDLMENYSNQDNRRVKFADLLFLITGIFSNYKSSQSTGRSVQVPLSPATLSRMGSLDHDAFYAIQ